MTALQMGRFVIDPTLTTVASLARISEPEFQAISEWIAEQRKTRQERAEQNERDARESAEELLVGIEARHAKQEAWSVKNS